MIGNQAIREAAFGAGVGARLVGRALSAAAELFKSHPRELRQEVTRRIAVEIEKQCRERAQTIDRISQSDVKECVMAEIGGKGAGSQSCETISASLGLVRSTVLEHRAPLHQPHNDDRLEYRNRLFSP